MWFGGVCLGIIILGSEGVLELLAKRLCND